MIGTDNPNQCPKCRAPLVRRRGPFQEFLGCSRFPECKGSRKIAVEPLKKEGESAAISHIQDAFDFIRKCGSVEKAIYWLNIADGCSQALANKEQVAAHGEIDKVCDEDQEELPI